VKRKRKVPGYSDRPRSTLLVTDFGDAVLTSVKLAIDSAQHRDEEHRKAGRSDDFKLGGGAFLFLRKYEIEALAELLERDTSPALDPLRSHFREAMIFDVRVVGRG
jgi:hypothetical protein